jgi:MYXO-CTERM domain-containing protein
MSRLSNHPDRGAVVPRIARASLSISLSIAALTLLAGSLLSPDADAAEAWVRWADTSNGVATGIYPVLTVAHSTHSIFYSYRFPVPDMKGRVYRADLQDPARSFTMMSQAGFDLPPPVNNPQFNVFSMTTNDAGEPILGLMTAGGYSTTNKLLRWDSASSTWVQPALFAEGASPGALAPNRAIYSLARAPDGTIWGGHQFSKISRSTDGGKSFAVISDDYYLNVSSPGFTSAASINGVVVGPDGWLYAGTEIGGGIYSPDQGASWRSLDAFWGNSTSPMRMASALTNCAGIGVTPDGKIVLQGGKPNDASIPDDLVHMVWIDPVNKVAKSVSGVKPGLLGGQDVHKILTTDSGDMFFIAGSVPFQDPMYGEQGGVYTSKDGLDWHTFNTGITWYVAKPPSGSTATTSLAVDGNDVYFATANGVIWHYNTVGNTMPPGGSGAGAGVGAGVGVGAGAGTGTGTGTGGGGGGNADNSALAGGCGCSVAGDRQSGVGMFAGVAAVALGLSRRRARRSR